MALAFQRDISQPFPRSGLAHPFVSTAIILGRLLCNFLELRQQLFVGNPSFYDDRNFWYGHSTNFHSEPSKIVRTNTDNTLSLSVEYFQSVPRLIHDSFFNIV